MDFLAEEEKAENRAVQKTGNQVMEVNELTRAKRKQKDLQMEDEGVRKKEKKTLIS